MAAIDTLRAVLAPHDIEIGTVDGVFCLTAQDFEGQHAVSMRVLSPALRDLAASGNRAAFLDAVGVKVQAPAAGLAASLDGVEAVPVDLVIQVDGWMREVWDLWEPELRAALDGALEAAYDLTIIDGEEPLAICEGHGALEDAAYAAMLGAWSDFIARYEAPSRPACEEVCTGCGDCQPEAADAEDAPDTGCDDEDQSAKGATDSAQPPAEESDPGDECACSGKYDCCASCDRDDGKPCDCDDEEDEPADTEPASLEPGALYWHEGRLVKVLSVDADGAAFAVYYDSAGQITMAPRLMPDDGAEPAPPGTVFEASARLPYRRDPRIPPVGTTIERRYKRQTYRLTVGDGEYTLERPGAPGVEVFGSLSDAAKAISGAAHVSGIRWWRLDMDPAELRSKQEARAAKRRRLALKRAQESGDRLVAQLRAYLEKHAEVPEAVMDALRGALEGR